MKLKIGTPYFSMNYENVSKVKAEGMEGNFTILPKHMDYVSVLIPCIVKFEINGEELSVAVDEGLLIKRGDEVKIAVREMIEPKADETMKSAIHRYYDELEENERKGREIMAKLEGEIIRNFMRKS